MNETLSLKLLHSINNTIDNVNNKIRNQKLYSVSYILKTTDISNWINKQKLNQKL